MKNFHFWKWNINAVNLLSVTFHLLSLFISFRDAYYVNSLLFHKIIYPSTLYVFKSKLVGYNFYFIGSPFIFSGDWVFYCIGHKKFRCIQELQHYVCFCCFFLFFFTSPFFVFCFLNVGLSANMVNYIPVLWFTLLIVLKKNKQEMKITENGSDVFLTLF